MIVPRAGAAVVLALLFGCSDAPQSVSRVEPPTSPPTPARGVVDVDSTPMQFRIDTLVRDLQVPWAMAMLPDGRLLVTERGGRILALNPETRAVAPWATLDVYAQDPGIGPEAGLMGIAIAPDFERTREVFVVATTWRTRGDRTRGLATRLWRRVAGRVQPEAALRYKNQVIRLVDRQGKGVAPTVVVDDLATNFYHVGGAIGFGPDGMLYMTTGDAMLPERVDGRGSKLARVLRFTRTGGVPADNPTPGDPTWAMGLRNAQAFAWMPDSSLIAVEHGPSGMTQELGRKGHDELNTIIRGADYGWPRTIGDEPAPGVTAPLFTWERAIAPTGLALYRGPLSDWHGSVLVAGLLGGLERVQLEREGAHWSVRLRQPLLAGQFGRLRALAEDDSGRILLTTSNRDARGIPRPGDDLLVRLTPVVGDRR